MNDHTPLEAQRLQTSQLELVQRIASIIREDGEVEPLKGVYLGRLSVAGRKVHSVLEPSLCIIAQGSKEVLVGNERYQYDPFHYLIAALELPRASQVMEASQERPYLSLRLELDPHLVSSVMADAGYSLAPNKVADTPAIAVSPMDTNLLDTVVRLVRLVETPAEVPMLMPMIVREIIYRLVKGDQSDRLCHLTMLGGYTPHIARAVQYIRQAYIEPLRIEELARELGMSVSGFYAHFKAATAMSPLQYQKQLRLQEAQRLMLSENFDATQAGYEVGYNDNAHFNREYKSLFGLPPLRHVQHLREGVDRTATPG